MSHKSATGNVNLSVDETLTYTHTYVHTHTHTSKRDFNARVAHTKSHSLVKIKLAQTLKREKEGSFRMQ
jgi:Sec7-like guanine-nucleotide exchange factor